MAPKIVSPKNGHAGNAGVLARIGSKTHRPRPTIPAHAFFLLMGRQQNPK